MDVTDMVGCDWMLWAWWDMIGRDGNGGYQAGVTEQTCKHIRTGLNQPLTHTVCNNLSLSLSLSHTRAPICTTKHAPCLQRYLESYSPRGSSWMVHNILDKGALARRVNRREVACQGQGQGEGEVGSGSGPGPGSESRLRSGSVSGLGSGPG